MEFADRMKGYEEGIADILQRFTKYKAEHKAMDYDDLLTYTEKLFRQHIAIRETYDKQFQYIMCDEYQDTNPVQNNIINWISQIYPNLMVVGDDNQSIYAFRHADIQNILGFKDAHPGCREFMLTENYRSTQEILDVANAMMTHATTSSYALISSSLFAPASRKLGTLIVLTSPARYALARSVFLSSFSRVPNFILKRFLTCDEESCPTSMTCS